MRSRWNAGDGERIFGQLYLADPGLAAAALPNELKVAAIIAGAPQFDLDDIEEQLFLHSLGGLRAYVSDEKLN